MYPKKKLISLVFIFSGLIIITATSLSIYVYTNPNDKVLGCASKPYETFCGTESTPAEKIKGKVIFNSNCVACHKINGFSCPDLIKGVFERMPNEKYFQRFITNEDSLRKANDRYAKELLENFPTEFVHQFNLTNEEIEDLKKYIR